MTRTNVQRMLDIFRILNEIETEHGQKRAYCGAVLWAVRVGGGEKNKIEKPWPPSWDPPASGGLTKKTGTNCAYMTNESCITSKIESVTDDLIWSEDDSEYTEYPGNGIHVHGT